MAIKLKSEPLVPTLAVVSRKTSELQLYENNPRKNDSEVPKMVELIKKFGFKVPILVRGDRIVDGHLRIKAAKALNLPEVPTIDVGDMAEPEERALRIALNRSVEWAKWDEDALGIEMKAIQEAGLQLSLTGFDTSEADLLIKKVTEATLVKPPKDPAGPVTKTKDADAGSPADPEYVSLTFHMSADNRDFVFTNLNEYRKKAGFTSVSSALIGLISETIQNT